MSADPTCLLRAQGLHATPQRIAVLRAVARRPHGSVEAIADEVRGELGTVSMQTIYDALATFVERGLVRRLEPAGSPALFDPRVGDHHHHAICRTCGVVQDVDCPSGAPLCHAPSADYGYEIDEVEVVYWGFCPRCRAAAGPRADRARTEVPEPSSTLPTRSAAEPASEGRHEARARPASRHPSFPFDPTLSTHLS